LISFIKSHEKSLKKLEVWNNLYVLKGYTFIVNENLVEIEASIDGATPEFIEKLATCVPNLKSFKMGIDSTVTIKHVLQQCKNLEGLHIFHRQLTDLKQKLFLNTAKEIAGEALEFVRNYGGNLKINRLWISLNFDEKM
jgi:hypothetical protein